MLKTGSSKILGYICLFKVLLFIIQNLTSHIGLEQHKGEYMTIFIFG